MSTDAKPIVVRAKQGRRYPMGKMSAYFVADGDETNSRMSVSEWWLEPNTIAPDTPSPHAHPEDHMFYVIEGEVSVIFEKETHLGNAGTYIFIPGGTQHTFENRASARAGFISVNHPGGFEDDMPGIVQWFNEKA